MTQNRVKINEAHQLFSRRHNSMTKDPLTRITARRYVLTPHADSLLSSLASVLRKQSKRTQNTKI